MKDYATGIVLTPPSPANSGTELTLESGHGDRLPDVPFKATAHPDKVIPTLDTAEQVLVTDVTGDVVTFERALGDTTAKNIAAGWRLSAAIFSENAGKIGDVIASLRATPPAGRLFMNGDTHDKADYPLLWQHVVDNPAYGEFTDTQFILTDMRQRMLLGKAASGTGSVLGETGGAIDHKHLMPYGWDGNNDFRMSTSPSGNPLYGSVVATDNREVNSLGSFPTGKGRLAYTKHENPPYVTVNFEVIAG